MIIRLRADQAGRDALPFEATKPSHLQAAVLEWQRTGHSLPASIDLWDDAGKWIAVPHPNNGLAFLRITGALAQPADVWPWLERQDAYSHDLSAMVDMAVSAVLIAPPKRPELVWRAPE